MSAVLSNSFESVTRGAEAAAGGSRAVVNDLLDGPIHALAPEASTQERLSAINAAQNPLLEAAQPLLRALADMPAELEPDGVTVFHRLLEREVVTFQSLCSNAQIKHEHVVAASYS